MAVSICSYCDCADAARRPSAGSAYCAECETHLMRIAALRQEGEGFLRIVETDRHYLRQRRATGVYVATTSKAPVGARRG